MTPPKAIMNKDNFISAELSEMVRFRFRTGKGTNADPIRIEEVIIDVKTGERIR